MGSNLPTAMSGYLSCPDCGQPQTPWGFMCGFGELSRCVNRKQPTEYRPDLFGPSVRASIALEDSNPTDKLRHELQVLVSAYTEQIDRLTEELEYERLKGTAYDKVYSAQQYILSNGRNLEDWYAPYCLLGKALNELNEERADRGAIWKKYNQSVIRQHADKQFVPLPSFKQRIVDYHNDRAKSYNYRAKSHEDNPEEGV